MVNAGDTSGVKPVAVAVSVPVPLTPMYGASENDAIPAAFVTALYVVIPLPGCTDSVSVMAIPAWLTGLFAASAT